MSYTKEVICIDCGDKRIVRKDSNPARCSKCSSAIGGKASKGSYQVDRKKCLRPECKNEIRKTLRDKYCSIECRMIDKRTERVCKYCGNSFDVYKSHMKSNTNSAGNFCSRPCYEKWMCKTGRTTGRGSQWKKTRNKVVSKFPFCAVCGTTKNIQVHHIIPFRITFDNSIKNLIPLCTKHHKIVENFFIETENLSVDLETQSLVWNNMLRNRQAETYNTIKGIINAGR